MSGLPAISSTSSSDHLHHASAQSHPAHLNTDQVLQPESTSGKREHRWAPKDVAVGVKQDSQGRGRMGVHGHACCRERCIAIQ